MPRKPVTPGRRARIKPRGSRPTEGTKIARARRLATKGVMQNDADYACGVGEDLTAEELCERRREWQSTLPRAT